MDKTVCIIQARMGSSRLPGKNLLPILNIGNPNPVTALDLIASACEKAGGIDEVVIACPAKDYDVFTEWAALQEEYTGRKFYVFGGSEDNVYQRVLEAAKYRKADTIVDITGDCPLVAAHEIKRVLRQYNEADHTDLKYISNVFPVRYVPDGWDVQVYSTTLMEALECGVECEAHSGWNIFQAAPVSALPYKPEEAYWRAAMLRLTLDTPEDLAVIRKSAERYMTLTCLSTRQKAKRFLGFLRAQNPEWWDNREVEAKKAGEG